MDTTLSTRSYVGFIRKAKEKNYEIILLFLSLNSKDLAINRVKTRVQEGGHNIPKNVIERRYENGLKNLFQLYIPIVDKWVLADNSDEKIAFIAEGTDGNLRVKNQNSWSILKKKYYGN